MNDDFGTAQSTEPWFAPMEMLVQSRTLVVRLTEANIHRVARKLGYSVEYMHGRTFLATPYADTNRRVAKIGQWVGENGQFFETGTKWKAVGTYTSIEDEVVSDRR